MRRFINSVEQCTKKVKTLGGQKFGQGWLRPPPGCGPVLYEFYAMSKEVFMVILKYPEMVISLRETSG